MTLYSPTFIFAFLPFLAAAYRVLPKNMRAMVLSAISLAFYIFASGKYFFVLPLLALFAYGLSYLGKKGFFICLAMLLLLRFYGIGEVGISFFILRAASYIYDGKPQKNFFKVFSYLIFFPCIHAGPLARYGDFEKGFWRDTDYSQMARGICLWLKGAFKKLFFADALYSMFETTHSGTTTLSAAVALFAYAMYIYFDFSGCSDMAIGVAAVFGFDIPKNFDFPYMSQTVSEFFRRWHMSLGRWLFDYVYIPLGGSKKGKVRTLVSLLAVWLVSALWHGSTYSYLIWGVYFFIICAAEKLILPKNFKIGRFCTFTLVLFGWVLFFSKTPADAYFFFTRLFSLGDTLLYCRADIYNALRYTPFLLISAFFASPLPRAFVADLYRRARPFFYLAAFPLFLLILSCILAGEHIPFLYASF